MSQRQAITLEWLKRVRPYALGNQDVGSEAWDAFRGGQELGEDSFDSFAQWLVQYWDWYVGLLAQRGVQIPESEKVQPVLQAEKPVETSRPYGRSVPVNIEGVTVSAVKNRTGTPALGHRRQVVERQADPRSVIPERPVEYAQRSTMRMEEAPWDKVVGKASAERMFHAISESSWITWVVRLYDIISNFLGLPILTTSVVVGGAAAVGMQLNAAHYVVFFVGSIAISFIEIFGLKALATLIDLSKAPATGDTYQDSIRKFTILIAGLTFLACIVLFFLDIYLSILPWVALFEGSIVGWIIGVTLSVLVEYMELDSHIKLLRTYIPAGRK